jgi:hypothetical protein
MSKLVPKIAYKEDEPALGLFEFKIPKSYGIITHVFSPRTEEWNTKNNTNVAKNLSFIDYSKIKKRKIKVSSDNTSNSSKERGI